MFRVLQLHNKQMSQGGVDLVIDNEAEMLRDAGNVVDTLFQPTEAQPGLAGAIKPTYNRAFCRELAARMASFKPDIVHVHTPFPLMSPAVFRTAKHHGAATVGTLHSFRWSCINALCLRDGQQCQDCVGSRFKTPAIQHRCYHHSYAASTALTLSLNIHRRTTFQHHVDRFTAFTEYTKSVAVRDGLPAEKIVVKPNFVIDPHPDMDRVGDFVLFMGRLVPEKGIDHLLEAWRRHGDRLPALVIAGDGRMRADVEAAVASGSNIRFLGWVSETDLEEVIAACRLVVVPSVWHEAGPMVVLRSMAAGRPLVVPDLDNFKNPGMASQAVSFYRPGDADALADAVAGMYPLGAERHVRETARSVHRDFYSREVSLRMLTEIYEAARSA